MASLLKTAFLKYFYLCPRKGELPELLFNEHWTNFFVVFPFYHFILFILLK